MSYAFNPDVNASVESVFEHMEKHDISVLLGNLGSVFLFLLNIHKT